MMRTLTRRLPVSLQHRPGIPFKSPSLLPSVSFSSLRPASSSSQRERNVPAPSTPHFPSSHSSPPPSASPSTSSSSSRPVTHHPFSPHLPSGVAVLGDFIVSHASGSYVHSTGGQRYLDFTCGIGVTSLGHCHPRVDAAVADQYRKGAHLQVNCYTSQPILQFAEKLGSASSRPASPPPTSSCSATAEQRPSRTRSSWREW